MKPENVMISRWKHVKVIDFGDAKYLDSDRNEEFKVDQDSDPYERMGLKDDDCVFIDADANSDDSAPL